MHCEVVSSLVCIEGKAVEVYGLEFYKKHETSPFKTVKDIFTEIKAAEKLCVLFNSYDVDELHIDDIIEDSLI